jgi:DNA polymerase-3 subunit beta
MQFTTTKDALASALDRVVSAAPTKPAIATLSNVRLVANGSLELFATSLHDAAKAFAPADTKTKGAALVPAARLASIVKAAPKGDIAIKIDGTKATIKAGSRTYSLPALDAADFPAEPKFEASTAADITSADLAYVLERASYAVSQDTTRAHLSSLRLELSPGKIRGVSTDGHRLAVVETESTNTVERVVLVPLGAIKGLLALLKSGATTRLTFGKEWLAATCEGVSYSTKLTDATFPPYEQVIPAAHSNRATAGRESLLAALGAVSVVTSQTGVGRVAFAKSSIGLAIENAEEAASDTVPAELSGESATVGLNLKYVADALKSLEGDSVVVEFGGELDPVVVRGDTNSLAVVMPARI